MLPGYSELHSSSILKELSSWRVKKAAGCSCRKLERGSASLCQHLHSLPSSALPTFLFNDREGRGWLVLVGFTPGQVQAFLVPALGSGAGARPGRTLSWETMGLLGGLCSGAKGTENRT